jgi:hypothetical protein
MADDRDLAPPLACPAGGDWPVIPSTPKKDAPASAATERAQDGMESPMTQDNTRSHADRTPLPPTEHREAREVRLPASVWRMLDAMPRDDGEDLGAVLTRLIEDAAKRPLPRDFYDAILERTRADHAQELRQPRIVKRKEK